MPSRELVENIGPFGKGEDNFGGCPFGRGSGELRWIYGAFGGDMFIRWVNITEGPSGRTWPFPNMDSEVSVVAKPLNRQLDYFYIVLHFFCEKFWFINLT